MHGRSLRGSRGNGESKDALEELLGHGREGEAHGCRVYRGEGNVVVIADSRDLEWADISMCIAERREETARRRPYDQLFESVRVAQRIADVLPPSSEDSRASSPR